MSENLATVFEILDGLALTSVSRISRTTCSAIKLEEEPYNVHDLDSKTSKIGNLSGFFVMTKL